MKKEHYNLIALATLGVLVGLAIHGFSSFITESPPEYGVSCPIEYSKVVCVNESSVIGFYNENNVSIKNVKIVVPKEGGEDVYNVREPLGPKKTEALTLFNSECPLEQSKVKLFWCCERCFNTTMDNPSEDIEMKS